MERHLSFPCGPQRDAQPLSLGQYHLLEELGRGGMGRVYKAQHALMGRVVALKVISPELVSDPVAVEWFLREVRASTQLNHPNIVMAYDANEAEGQYFLVMEYVHGVTLDALVKQRGPLTIPYICELIRQVALGLQHAHEQGMVHRDIKPSNLLILASQGDTPPQVLVKILDFGLARLHGKSTGDTIALRGESSVLGTPDYIAPEQSRDIHAADIRSDLYSLGCVFYFALTGRVPFPGDNAVEKLIKHLTEQPEPVEKVREDVPPTLAAIVRRLMAKDPADRYQTPAELVRELEEYQARSNKTTGEMPASLSPAVGETAELSSAGALESASPTQLPHTCVLDHVKIFTPAQESEEPSGPSWFPSWDEYVPGEKRLPETHETLTLSPPEETEEVTAEAIAASFPRLEPLPLPRPDPHSQSVGGTAASPADALPSVDPVVFRLWHRWVRLLEMIVAGRGFTHVNNEDYQTTHTLLLQSCRAAIDACPASERRALYEECLSLAQPWLKLQSFVHIDSVILDSLLHRCRQIEVELNDGKTPWTIRQVLGLILLAFSPAGAALWYWYYGQWGLSSLLRTFSGDFSAASLRLAWNFLWTHPPLLMGMLFPLAIIFSTTLLFRTPR